MCNSVTVCCIFLLLDGLQFTANVSLFCWLLTGLIGSGQDTLALVVGGRPSDSSLCLELGKLGLNLDDGWFIGKSVGQEINETITIQCVMMVWLTLYLSVYVCLLYLEIIT